MKGSFESDSAPSEAGRNAVLRILEDDSHIEAQVALGAHPHSAPEVLYYLAAEGDARIRKAVAANPSTPPQANEILAGDSDDDVRAELARKIGRLMPDLTSGENKRLCQLTLATLDRLAHDQLPRVRAILSEEIKNLTCVPKHIIDALARDIETEVSVPILEYSPLLSAADLTEIVACAQASQVLCAVARRKPLSENVSDAIVTSLDIPAVAALLANPKASIRRNTMDSIAKHARAVRQWHVPLVMRIELSQRAIRRIAGFVGSELLSRLAARHELDEGTRRKLARELRRRTEKPALEPEAPPAERAMSEARAALGSGHLDEAFIEAAVDTNRRESVIAGLALRAGISADLVRRMFNAHSAKAITALTWRAGLSMRVAFKIQTGLLRLPASELLPARAGVHYPLSEDEMRWHLGYFGVAA